MIWDTLIFYFFIKGSSFVLCLNVTSFYCLFLIRITIFLLGNLEMIILKDFKWILNEKGSFGINLCFVLCVTEFWFRFFGYLDLCSKGSPPLSELHTHVTSVLAVKLNYSEIQFKKTDCHKMELFGLGCFMRRMGNRLNFGQSL